MKILFALVLTSIVLFSCQDLKKDAQLKKITALKESVTTIQTDFNKNKVDTLNRVISSVFDVEFRIRRNYKSDTINTELGKKVNAYKMIRKRLKPIAGNYIKLEKGTKEELEALTKLEKDIQNNSGDKAKYDEYITFEEDKVEQLKMVLSETIENQNNCLKTFKELHKELNDFSWSLVNKK